MRRYSKCDGMLGVTIRNLERDGAGASCVTPRPSRGWPYPLCAMPMLRDNRGKSGNFGANRSNGASDAR